MGVGSYGQNGGGVGLPGVGGAVTGVVRGKQPGGAGARWFEVRAPGGLDLGGKFWGKAKFHGFRGGKGGDEGVGARFICQTTNPWTKTTKSHKILQIARKLFGAIFVGIFEFGRKTPKSS